jgi:hypothetical protein
VIIADGKFMISRTFPASYPNRGFCFRFISSLFDGNVIVPFESSRKMLLSTLLKLQMVMLLKRQRNLNLAGLLSKNKRKIVSELEMVINLVSLFVEGKNTMDFK